MFSFQPGSGVVVSACVCLGYRCHHVNMKNESLEMELHEKRTLEVELNTAYSNGN